MQEPLPAHKRAEILVRVAGALGRRHDEVARPHLGRGRQADEGRARRGRTSDVDLHVRSGRGAEARRRDGPDGRGPGGRGEARVHAPAADRRRRRDQPVQLPAQPRRAQARAGARRGLRRRAQAGEPDPAVGAAPRGTRAGGRAAARLAERARRPRVRDRRRARRGRAREADHVHGLRRRRLGAEAARAEEARQSRARERDASRSSRPTPT